MSFPIISYVSFPVVAYSLTGFGYKGFIRELQSGVPPGPGWYACRQGEKAYLHKFQGVSSQTKIQSIHIGYSAFVDVLGMGVSAIARARGDSKGTGCVCHI